MPRKPKLVTSHFLSYDLVPPEAVAGLSDEGPYPVPDEIMLMPPTGFMGRDGSGPWTFSFDAIRKAFVKDGKPLTIDYDHQSLNADQKAGPVPAAGFANDILQKGDGSVWAVGVEWTAEAREAISEREYRFISPVFLHKPGSFEVQAIFNAALTNNPNLYLAALNSAASAYTNDETQEPAMLKSLLEKLGLTETATEAEALAAIDSLTANSAKAAEAETAVATANSRIAELEPQAAKVADLEGQLATANSALATAQSEVATLKATAHAAEITAAVEGAVKAGRITPAQAAHARSLAETNLAAFSAFISGAPVVPNTQASQAPAGEGEGKPELTSTEMSVVASLGIKPETFLAGKKS